MSGKVLKTMEEVLESITSRTGQDQLGRADLHSQNRFFHATDVPTIGTDGNVNFKLGTHFGSEGAAHDRIMTRVNNGDSVGPEATYPVRIDYQRPYDVVDNGSQHSAEDFANLMFEDGLMDVDEWVGVGDMVHWDMDTNKRVDDEAWEFIRDRLEEEGFDSITYTNMVEGAGEESVIPLRPEQVRGEFAQYNPDNAMSPNLMASAAGASVVGMAATASQKADAGESLTMEELLALEGHKQAEESAPTPTRELGTLDTIRGAVQQYTRGASFGTADEFVAMVRASIDSTIDNMAGVGDATFEEMGVELKPQEWGDTYAMMAADERENRAAFVDAHPVSATLLEIAGGFATGGASVKVANALMPAAKAGLAGAGAGVIDGAIYGFADADADVATRFKEAAKWGAVGGVFGGAVGKGVEKLAQRKADKLSSAAARVTEKYRDNLTLAVDEGLSGQHAVEAAMQRTRITPEELKKAMDVNGVKPPNIPDPESAARAAPNIREAQRELTETPAGWLDKFGNPADYIIRKSSDRLARISPRLSNEMRRMEMRVHNRTQKWLKGVQDWEKHYRGLNKGQQSIIARALFNNDVGSAMQVLDKEGQKALKKARGVLRQTGRSLRGVGYDLRDNPDYYPRTVKDYAGLQAQRGKTVATEAEAHIAKAADKEKAYADWLLAREGGPGGVGNTKARTIDTVSEEMMPFYGDAVESLSGYIHKAASDVEMKRFFNQRAGGGNLRKLLQKRAEDGTHNDAVEQIALDGAIDRLLKAEGIVGNADAEKVVRDIIKGRFTTGRMGMNGKMKGVKDVGTISALGNIPATITQIGDLANAMFFNGGRDTLMAIGQTLARRGKIPLSEIGLDNRLNQDLQTAEGLTKWVSNILDATGFKAMDRFGKNVLAQGSINKARRQLKNAKGEAEFRKQWGSTFGGDIEGVISNLRAGNYADENVKLLAFNTVSDAQPVSLMEMPQAYLDNPNGRIMYTLKSYAVNQLNILANTINNPRVPEQTRVDSFRQLGSFLAYTGMINGTVMEVKGMLRGDEFNIEDIPDNVVDSLMGLAFINRYNIDHFYGKGDIAGGIMNTIAPPVPSGPQAIPIVGQMVNDWFLGGKENRAERRAKDKGEFYLDTSLDLDLDMDLDI